MTQTLLLFFIQAKKETLDIKARRLGIAEDEYEHLTAALSGMHSASSTSSRTYIIITYAIFSFFILQSLKRLCDLVSVIPHSMHT